MPRCPVRVAQVVRECDLPILPWLAPRVFQPWPTVHGELREHTRHHSNHSRSTGTNQQCRSAHRIRRFDFSIRSLRTTALDHTPSRLQFSTQQGRTRSNDRPPIAPDNSRESKKWYRNDVGTTQAAWHVDGGPDPLTDAKEARDHRTSGRQRSLRSEKRKSRRKDERAALTKTRKLAFRPPVKGSQGWSSLVRHVTSSKGPSYGDPLVELSNGLSQWEKLLWSYRNRRKDMLRQKRKKMFSKTRVKFVTAGRPVRTAGDSAGRNGQDQRPLADTEKLGEDFEFVTADYSDLWGFNFARLNNKYDKYTSTEDPNVGPLRIHPMAQEASRAILADPTGKDLDSFEQTVHQLDRGSQTWLKLWANAMLWILEKEPDKGVKFLRMTHKSPFVSRTWVEDSLQYLSTHFSATDDREMLKELLDLLPDLMVRPGAPPLRLEASHIRKLLPVSDVEHVLKLHESIKANGVVVHGNTLLHMATTLANTDHLHTAMECLLEAEQNGVDKNSDAFMSTCATILRKSADQPEGLRVCLTIIQNLVDLGVRINVQLCNIVILNAVKAGDLSTAFAVHQKLVEYGLQADHYTYAILLTGCKQMIHDPETLQSTIHRALQTVDITSAPILAAQILHCIYVHHFYGKSVKDFRVIENAYSEMFDVEPLITLGIIPESVRRLYSDKKLMSPTLAALGLMVSGWMRCDPSPLSTYRVYSRFMDLVRAGEKPFVDLAATDHIFNTFLLAFTSHPRGMQHATQLVHDMQLASEAGDLENTQQSHGKHSAGEAALLEASLAKLTVAGDNTAKVSPPTVKTLSILLGGFSKHHQTDMAERVLTYMRERNLKPNIVTWNSLLWGYAGMQDARGALNVLRQMDQAGVPGDERTAEAARRLNIDEENFVRYYT